MADGGLLLIYRSMSTGDLQDLKDMLLNQMLSLKDYTSMTGGTKSFTRDLRQLTAQLEAVTFVLNERSGSGYDATGVIDFKGTGSSPPAGTEEMLNYYPGS
jgi:hypothetical protein